MALHRINPNASEDADLPEANYRYPPPLSAMPTPNTSRATSPTSSRAQSDDEEEYSDHSEDERAELSAAAST